MLDSRFALPPNLPVPLDDGAASHLLGAQLPSIYLRSTYGGAVNIAALNNSVLFFYPRSGVPGELPATEWDAIPGARGCTPQSCAFRDIHQEFAAMGVSVHGVSTQTTEYQIEFATRYHLPFPILSDAELELVRAMRLPTFEFDSSPYNHGCTTMLIKRMAWYTRHGRIEHVWYPVFPPDRGAAVALDWLREQRSC